MDAIIRMARDGDEGAARALHDRYAGRLRAAVMGWVRDPAAADDLCQDAWLRAFRGIGRFRGESEFGSWLYAIARNVVIEWGRSEQRRGGLDERVAAEVGVRAEWAVSTNPEPVELRIDLRRAVSALPEGMREVLWLHDVEGWTHGRIGEQLGIAEGTSKSQLFKARAKLRESLSPALAVA